MDPLPGEHSVPELDLRHYVGVLRRRRWLIVGITLAVGLAALLRAETETERYRARADLLVRSITGGPQGTERLGAEAERAVGNEIEIITGAAVRAEVAELLGRPAPGVDAGGKANTDIIVVEADATDADEAAEAVNTYTEAYVNVRTADRRARIETQLEQAREERTRKRADLQTLAEPIQALDRRIDDAPPGADTQALADRREQLADRIQPEQDQLFLELTELENQIDDLAVELDNPSEGVELLNPASVPAEPYTPTPRRDTLVGLAVGLLLGLVVAFLWENLDDRLRSREDLLRALGGPPVLGAIPDVDQWRTRDTPRPALATDPQSGTAECYRSLATSVRFLARDRSCTVIQITSPAPGEGKTTTAVNLAAALAETTPDTLLVDADLRLPNVHTHLAIESDSGLSTVLAGQVDPATAIVHAPLAGVDVIPAGQVPPNPIELLGGGALAETLAKLAESYRLIIIDSPPVLPVTDATIIAGNVDAVAVVASAGRSRRRQMRGALQTLAAVDVEIGGVVLNMVAEADSEYGYRYDYGYGAPPPNRRQARRAEPG